MKKITIETGSAMFHLYQPGLDGLEEEFASLEGRENDWYHDTENNDSANYQGEGDWEIDGKAYLEKYLVPNWVDAFKETIEDRIKRYKSSIKIKIVPTGVSSPREYNFETDNALFNIVLSLKDARKIKDEVFKYQDEFVQYLHEYHRSRDGFWSYMPYTLPDWAGRWEQEPESDGWDRAFVCLFEFWLFAFPGYESEGKPSLENMEGSIEEFRDTFDRYLEESKCNGGLEDCWRFVEAVAQ